MSSYVVLPSEKVRELCTKKLAWIEERREEAVETWIRDTMATVTRRDGWFKPRRPITRAEAIDIGEEPYFDGFDPNWTALNTRRRRFSNAKERCHMFLLAAAHAAEVSVSVDDLEAIS